MPGTCILSGKAVTRTHARAKGTDEHERGETDKGVYVVADEGKPSEEGQPMNQTSLQQTWGT